MSLIDQNEYLQEENRQLRAMLVSKDFKMPREWKLSMCEERLLSSLYAAPNGVRSHAALRVASCINTESDQKVVEVRVCQMRKKLKPFEIQIKTVWGEGYELTKASRLIIKEALSQ